jgi:hypothetical protein
VDIRDIPDPKEKREQQQIRDLLARKEKWVQPVQLVQPVKRVQLVKPVQLVKLVPLAPLVLLVQLEVLVVDFQYLPAQTLHLTFLNLLPTLCWVSLQ